MDEFILYGTLGLNHVLDLSAYDHLLFLIVLAGSSSVVQLKNKTLKMDITITPIGFIL